MLHLDVWVWERTVRQCPSPLILRAPILLGVSLLGRDTVSASSAVLASTLGRCSFPTTISPGNNLSSIARRWRTTFSAFVDANPHPHAPNFLAIGAALALPQNSPENVVSRTRFVAETHVIIVKLSILDLERRVTITEPNLAPGRLSGLRAAPAAHRSTRCASGECTLRGRITPLALFHRPAVQDELCSRAYPS
uniref:LysM peptidoglycan-binding domain-containing protein n=1 Tax=Microvirga soli TaxID=1854496 RepID=UPI00191F15E0